jgi:hypothetical protein
LSPMMRTAPEISRRYQTRLQEVLSARPPSPSSFIMLQGALRSRISGMKCSHPGTLAPGS